MPYNPASLKNLVQNKGDKIEPKESDENRSLCAASDAQVVSPSQTVIEHETPLRQARELLDATAPMAAVHLHRVVTGATRVPPHVRVQAAIKVLEGAGLLNQQPTQSPQQSEQFAVTLGALAQALELKRRQQQAQDAG